ncbi:MAG: hypothetical protein WCK02_01460 [Bacteroidota bacterium]
MKKLLLFTFILLVATSCKKYPDGPLFSLSSKKARLCRTWISDRYFINGVDKTTPTNPLWTGYKLEFRKNGEVQYYNHPKYNSTAGSWSFDSDKANLSITLDVLNEYSVIERLTSSELWLSKNDGTNVVETHFIAE